MIGEKIKDLRVKNQMTQKDLADKLYVTYQAVSRWENGEVEPSISTIKEMAKIFGVGVNELLETEEPVKETIVEKEIVYKEAPKQVLTICEVCNKPLYEPDEIKRYDHKGRVRHGRHYHTVSNTVVMCEECYNKKMEEIRLQKEKLEAERRAKIKKRRNIGFVLSALVLTICLVISIVGFVKSNSALGAWMIVLGISGAAFIGCVIMNNTFITEMWVSVASWSIHLPGVIFTLDLDGIIWLITIKLLGAILSLFVSILCVMLATALGCALGIFTYPFSLGKSLKYAEDNY